MFRLLKLENFAYEHLMQGRNSCGTRGTCPPEAKPDIWSRGGAMKRAITASEGVRARWCVAPPSKLWQGYGGAGRSPQQSPGAEPPPGKI